MNNLLAKIKILRSILLAFLFTIIANAFSGIVGNGADAAFQKIFPKFLQGINSIKFSLFTGFLICLIFIIIIFFLYDELKQLTKNINDFDKLDKKLNLIMHNFYESNSAKSNSISSLDELNSNLIILKESFLSNIKSYFEEFYEVDQLTLFLPNPSEPETLFISEAIPPMSEKIHQDLKCYFGEKNQSQKRGLAGYALYKEEIIKIQLKKEKERLEIYPKGRESEEYILLGNLQVAYKSSVAIPIVINEEKMGVLCLDTHKITNIDSKKNDIIFEQIAQRILRLIETQNLISFLQKTKSP